MFARQAALKGALARSTLAKSSVYGLVRPLAGSVVTPVREFHAFKRREYAWVTIEAEELIAKAYERHQCLADKGESFPPSLALKDLESVGQPFHYTPKTFGDKVALQVTNSLEKLMSLFFRDKYDHHAVTLETLAAVPGIVGAMHRHLRSLRRMKRDHGWINPLLEEAENERMHLLIWMQHTKPTAIERAFVMVAQAGYFGFYASMYAVSPKTAHRAVGYLEEAAHRAYTEYLEAIDEGHIKNVPAGKIAKEYYRLPDTATLRDVVLQVRADECMHRDFNHHLACRIEENKEDEHPVSMMQDVENFKGGIVAETTIVSKTETIKVEVAPKAATQQA